MSAFSRKLIDTLSNKVRKSDAPPTQRAEEKLVIDYTKISNKKSGAKITPFNIKTESSYNSYLSDKSFALGIKTSNCIAWTDIPEQKYQDHVIEAKFRLDSLGGYAAAGIVFRIMDEDSYYLALVSSKGYFRLDAVKDGSPKTLIAWTEISDFNNTPEGPPASKRKTVNSKGVSIAMNIITYGTYLIFLVNGKWVGETNDSSITSGRLGFALASYGEENKDPGKTIHEPSAGPNEQSIPEITAELPVQNKKRIRHMTDNNEQEGKYVCIAYLDYISVDTRLKAIEENFKKWTDESNINAECRLRLAETLAVMNEYSKALDQIEKAWKRRDDAIRSVTVGYSKVRTRKELLLAARMSLLLNQYKEAYEYINWIHEQWPDSAEAKLTYTEKMKLLVELKKFRELKDFMLDHSMQIGKNLDYYTLLARSYYELEEYKNSADMWEKAFKLKKTNGVYAVNSANSYEIAKKNKKALKYYITAAKIFLNDDNVPELTGIMPKLSALGENDWEAHAILGKWAFSIEDYQKCEKEFDTAEKIRLELVPQPEPDPALYYLWGLVYCVKGTKKSAVRMIEKAVKLAPDYELFSAKLSELKSGDKPVRTRKSGAEQNKTQNADNEKPEQENEADTERPAENTKKPKKQRTAE